MSNLVCGLYFPKFRFLKLWLVNNVFCHLQYVTYTLFCICICTCIWSRERGTWWLCWSYHLRRHGWRWRGYSPHPSPFSNMSMIFNSCQPLDQYKSCSHCPVSADVFWCSCQYETAKISRHATANLYGTWENEISHGQWMLVRDLPTYVPGTQDVQSPRCIWFNRCIGPLVPWMPWDLVYSKIIIPTLLSERMSCCKYSSRSCTSRYQMYQFIKWWWLWGGRRGWGRGASNIFIWDAWIIIQGCY